MKKLAILAAILVLIPASVMAGMNILNESSLNDVTGQVGITIDSTVEVDAGFLAWGDRDGYDSTISAGGFVTLQGLSINNGSTGSGMAMTGLKLDAGTDTTKSYLVITLPSINGQIGIADLVLDTTAGATATTTNSLGSITIGNLSVPGSTVKISAH